MDIMYIFLWIGIALMGVISFVSILLAGNKPIAEFIIWFVVSLIGSFLLVSTIGNEFTISFIVALTIAIVAMRK